MILYYCERAGYYLDSVCVRMTILKGLCPPGDTPYDSLYGEAPPGRGTFSGFRYMKG